MTRSVYWGFFVTCTLAISMQIQADEPGASSPPGGFLTEAAVSDDELDGYRGGEGIDVQTINTAELDGNLEGNSAVNSVTGDNVISHGAFANASGLSTAIQNSGNNVLIQNSTIVNVVIEESPVR